MNKRKHGMDETKHPLNNTGLSSVKILLIVAISLALILGVLAAVLIPKMKDKKDDLSKRSTSKVSSEKNDESSRKSSEDAQGGVLENLIDNFTDDTPARKPEFRTEDYQYTKLADLLGVMIENEIVSENGNKMSKDWKTVTDFLEIGGKVTGIGYYNKDKDTRPKDELTYYYYSKDTLKKLSYAILGEELPVDSLEEIAKCFGEDALKKDSFVENGWAFVEDDYLVTAIGEAGYVGREPMYFRTKYLGKGQWEIVANVVEEDYDIEVLGQDIYPYKWLGNLVVTVEEDENSIIDGYRIVDTKWADAMDPQCSADWQRAYFDVIQQYYYGGDDFWPGYLKKYDLIYFNNDDIPDLVVNIVGFNTSVYCFNEKTKTAERAFSGAYGIAGLTYYGYVAHEGIVVWLDIDYAGLEYNYYAEKLNENNSMEPLLGHDLNVKRYIDSNGNGYPDADEYDENAEEEYCFVDGKEVSSEEFNKYLDEIPDATGDLTEDRLDYWTILDNIFTSDVELQ